MAETVQEAKDTTRWRAIWETAIVDGERVKLYKLTKGGLDQLDNAAPYCSEYDWVVPRERSRRVKL